MEVLVEKTKEKKEMRFCGKVKELLKKLKINPETVIVVRNGELVNEEDFVSGKDIVRIMSVISGG